MLTALEDFILSSVREAEAKYHLSLELWHLKANS